MSEKVTFQELIEAIAEETKSSKQFTHDFLKDFVDVINTGLESDGSVNIAGFGKFNLKEVNEREGYNPQTEEKMTIPAHNKIVFKPYKDLRELVNAPYSHLEAELIEAEEDETEDTEEPAETPKEDDFIPMAPPTAHSSLSQSEDENDEDEIEENFEDPFGFEQSGANTSSTFSYEEDPDIEEAPPTEDIVEYHEKEQKDETEERVDDFLNLSAHEDTDIAGSDTEDSTDPEESLNEEIDSQEISPFESVEDVKEEIEGVEDEETDPFAFDEQEVTEETEPAPALSSASTINDKDSPKEDNVSYIPILAAVIALLLLAGGAWYFGFFDNQGTTPPMASNTVSLPKKDDNPPPKPEKKATKSAQQKTANKPKDHSKQNAATTAQTNPAANQKQEKITIEKGQTLWSIAHSEYDNPRLWPWIYDHNQSLDNPDLIIAGNSLSVPLPSGPQYGLTSSDSIAVAKGYIATYRWYKDNGLPRAKNYLWVAKRYHSNIQNIADVKIDKADLAFANQAK